MVRLGPSLKPCPMNAPVDLKTRWGQERRLAFIDLRLQYDGKLNRSDLTSFFGISAPQASQDLARYLALAPDNLWYDGRSKMYVATTQFSPKFGDEDARTFLNETQALATGVLTTGQSFIGFLPPVGVVPTPSRPLSAKTVALFVEAIRNRRALELEYQSMREPRPVRYVVSPHAFGFDGLRWHARAYCHDASGFRDFAIGRCNRISRSDTKAVDPDGDLEWNTIVSIVLAPHPHLSPDQRHAVEHDYGMKAGKNLFVPCRQAMLYYTLRHLNLASLEIHADPARQHVVVENAEQVRQWLHDTSAL